MTTTNKLSKIQGALIGGAIGDAIGFIIEKQPLSMAQKFSNSLNTLNSYTQPHRTYPKNYKFGQYSDDTQFSKLLIQSFLTNQDFKKLLVNDFVNQKLIGLGKNTSKLLTKYSNNLSVSSVDLNNISNGSVMRSWTIGLLFTSPLEILTESNRHSEITHNTPEARGCCNFIAQIMNSIIENNFDSNTLLKFCPDFMKSDLDHCLNFTDSKDLALFLKSSLTPDWDGVPPLAVNTTLAALTIFSVYQKESFKTNLCQVLSLGGDTDSTASIVGALWGAVHGLDSIDTLFRGIIHDNDSYTEDYFIDLGKQILKFRTSK